MKITIHTNNVPRPILSGWDLTEREREEFQYIEGEEDCLSTPRFVRYKRRLYDLNEFLGPVGDLRGWHGYQPDSFYSGVVFKSEDWETVVMGTYLC